MRLQQFATPVALSLLMGCPAKEQKAPASKSPAAAKEKAAPAEPAPAKAAPAADAADPACMSPWNPTGKESVIKVGAREFQVQGTKLTETTKDEDGRVVLGVLADIKEDTPENLKNIDDFLGFFKENDAEGIVVVGDVGEKRAQIETVLTKLAESGLPVFVVIGNRESKADFNGAVAAVNEKHTNVFNLNALRLASIGDVALVSVPGYYNKVYIHAADGCSYSPADLEATKPAVKAAEGKTVVLVSHGPPQQDGTDALDRTAEQANVGDPALAKFIESTGIRFGVFANIHEAGGRATDLAGKNLVAPKTMVDSLFLSAGPTDAVSWKMNDGTESQGMAGLLTIKGRQGAFEIKRAAVAKAAK